jgi:hypothetical protein
MRTKLLFLFFLVLIGGCSRSSDKSGYALQCVMTSDIDGKSSRQVVFVVDDPRQYGPAAVYGYSEDGRDFYGATPLTDKKVTDKEYSYVVDEGGGARQDLVINRETLVGNFANPTLSCVKASDESMSKLMRDEKKFESNERRDQQNQLNNDKI